MIDTFLRSFSLKNTYRVNGILYALKQIPLIKRILPDALYKVRGLKIFANVISVMWEILSAFLGKLIYFGIIAATTEMYDVAPQAGADLFLHVLLFLTFIGAYSNTYMFNPTKDKYYAMILLGMNAREYTLGNYIYTIVKNIIGFLPFGILFGMFKGLSIWQSLLIPFFILCLKMAFAAYELWRYEKRGIVTNENKLGVGLWVAMGVLLAAAYGLPALGVIVPGEICLIFMVLSIVAGLLSLWKIITFKYYHELYKELLFQMMGQFDASMPTKMQQEQSFKNISTDKNITSKKEGFEYLNELFIKRHRKILWKSTIKITAFALFAFAAILLVFQLNPGIKGEINDLLMTFLPYFVFVMYMINRGTGFTRALFVNCDHSLLTYSFYKQPKRILKLFQIRLREIIKINLLPAAVIGMGLAFLLFITGGTDNPLNYLVIFVTIVSLSIFFSVHYLTLYYLLQPFNAGTEIKSGTYQVIMSATYVVCYGMMQMQMSTIVFGAVAIAFCVLYSLVACVLVYLLAPKTFKIRV